MKYILVILQFALPLALSTSPSCYDENKIIYCEYMVLHRLSAGMFPLLNSSLRELYFYHGKVRFLDSDAFGNMSNLQVLDLSHNDIEYLDSYIFFSCSNLQTLSMFDNLVHFLGPHELFYGLRNLKKLNFSSNEIANLNSSIFLPLESIEKIDLLKNRLICNDELKNLKIWSNSKNASLMATCTLNMDVTELINRNSCVQVPEKLPEIGTDVQNQAYISKDDIHMPIWLFVVIIASSKLLILFTSWLIIRLRRYRKLAPEEDKMYDSKEPKYDDINADSCNPKYLSMLPELPKRFEDKSESNQSPFQNVWCELENKRSSGYMEARKVSGGDLQGRVWDKSESEVAKLPYFVVGSGKYGETKEIHET